MRKLRPAFFVFAAVTLAMGITGCTRRFYRVTADKEVDGILAEKDVVPTWKIEQYHVYPDPRSRFADPYDPDHPPMPPDDYATFALSPHSQFPGKAGVGSAQGTAWLEMVNAWDAANREDRKAADAREIEESEGPSLLPAPKEVKPGNPRDSAGLTAGKDGAEIQLTSATAAQLKPATGPTPDKAPIVSVAEVNPRRPVSTYFDEFVTAKPPGFVLKLDQTVELGVFNSPTYQTFREELYEAALPVSQERYNFSYQFAATEDWIRQWAGPDSSVGEQNRWTGTSTLSFTKLFSTGAMLSFDFVNNNIFNFLAPRGFTSVSNIDLNFTQPFLQGGGKAVTLEPLTESERELLYSIRAYARFREQFYVGIAIGATLPSNLPAAVGFSGGGGPISILAALGIASTDVSGGFNGYLSTLFRECDLAVDKKYVAELEKALRIYEGYQEGGQFSPLQVDQVRSTLLQAQNTVLVDIQNVTNAVDQFKVLLGMPANTPLILDDAPARPITRQYDRYYEVITDSDAAYKRVEAQENLAPEKVRALLMDIYTKDQLVRGTSFPTFITSSWEAMRKATDAELTKRLKQLRDERRRLLDRKTDVELKGGSLSEQETTSLRNAEIEADVAALEQLLRRYEAKPWMAFAKEELRRQDRLKLFRLVAYSAEIVLVWARNERFQNVGKLWPERATALLGDLDLSIAEANKAQEEAVRYSLSHRWDLMNARAQVVDAWRQLRVTANALMGVFNVEYHLDSHTPANGTKPFAFSTSRTNQTLTLDTQLPLNRLSQRNAYRTALISYQEARRGLITLEDNIAVQVRFDVRQLQLFAANYRIQKRVLQSLYAQVENALELITAPADPAALQATGTSGAANAAALTSQYLSALSSLNGAQTRMYDIWLSYIATRMQLYLDLESLRMDERGIWVEGPITTADYVEASGVSCLAGLKAPMTDIPVGEQHDSEIPNPKLPDQ
jgi:outer membrane protein TolC